MEKEEELIFSKNGKKLLEDMGLTESQVQKLYDKYERCPFCNDYEWYGCQIVYHLNMYKDTCLKKFKKKIIKEEKI